MFDVSRSHILWKGCGSFVAETFPATTSGGRLIFERRGGRVTLRQIQIMGSFFVDIDISFVRSLLLSEVGHLSVAQNGAIVCLAHDLSPNAFKVVKLYIETLCSQILPNRAKPL